MDYEYLQIIINHRIRYHFEEEGRTVLTKHTYRMIILDCVNHYNKHVFEYMKYCKKLSKEEQKR